MIFRGETILIVAGISGAAAVGLGAFGAHGLANRVSPSDIEIWKTAAQYHLVHTVAVAAVALFLMAIKSQENKDIFQSAKKQLSWVTALFVFGMLIFSGSLYTLVLTNVRWLGAITPIGGLLLIAGWLGLALAGLRTGERM